MLSACVSCVSCVMADHPPPLCRLLGSTDFQARLKAIAETEAMTVAGLKKWSIVPRSLTIKRKYVMRVSCVVCRGGVHSRKRSLTYQRRCVCVWCSELTPTMSLRREAVVAHFEREIEARAHLPTLSLTSRRTVMSP
jgi:hypothetical protein